MFEVYTDVTFITPGFRAETCDQQKLHRITKDQSKEAFSEILLSRFKEKNFRPLECNFLLSDTIEAPIKLFGLVFFLLSDASLSLFCFLFFYLSEQPRKDSFISCKRFRLAFSPREFLLSTVTIPKFQWHYWMCRQINFSSSSSFFLALDGSKKLTVWKIFGETALLFGCFVMYDAQDGVCLDFFFFLHSRSIVVCS